MTMRISILRILHAVSQSFSCGEGTNNHMTTDNFWLGGLPKIQEAKFVIVGSLVT